MALSGSASGYIAGTDNHYGIKYEWSATQDIATNTSKILVKVWMIYYWSINIDSRVLTVTIDGTKYQHSTGTLHYNGSSASSTQFLHTFTHTVNHDSAGNKNFSISVSFPFSMTSSTYGWIGTATLKSGTLTLNTIPRTSSITSAGNVTLGNTCNIKWTPATSSFVYKLKFVCGSISYTTDWISPNTTSAYTYTGYTMTIDKWSSAMPNTYSATCNVSLFTYSSKNTDNQIGSASNSTFTLTLPSAIKPTVTFATPTLVDGWNGYYLQGRSKCTLSATFKAGNGSTIKSCSISGTGISLSGTGSSLSGTTDILTKEGTFTYTAKVTDGRTSVSTTRQIVVQAYSRPTLSLSAIRSSSSGKANITYKTSCSSVNNANTLQTLKIYQKPSTSETWPSSAVYTVSLNSLSPSGTIVITGLDDELSYNFKGVVVDAVGTSVDDVVYIPSAFKLVNVNKNKTGLSIGKMADPDSKIFDCNLDAKFLKTLQFGTNMQGKLMTEQVTNNEGVTRNIVYLQTGQDVDGGSTMGLALNNSSVYIANEANSGKINLGESGRKWNQLYAANGTIATSDRNIKTDILEMSNAQELLFNKLKPVTFKFVDGTSGRTHYGFVSQDVEESLIDANLTGLDFAGFCKDVRLDENGNPILDENGQTTYNYSLRYSEFIALNTYMIQRLQVENAELKAELKELKEMIVSNASSNNME